MRITEASISPNKIFLKAQTRLSAVTPYHPDSLDMGISEERHGLGLCPSLGGDIV
jgi:hypothetical protein